MSWWGVFVLTVMAVPVLLVVGLCVTDYRHNRRIRTQPGRTVESIRQRLERERADEAAAGALTEVIPTTQPTLKDDPTDRMSPVDLPKRHRRYVQQPLRSPSRPPSAPPEGELMHRVLEGLRKLPEERPGPAYLWPGADPDLKAERNFLLLYQEKEDL